MFCRYCGKEIPNDTLICPHCGANLEKRVSNDVVEAKEELIDEQVVEPVYHERNKAIEKVLLWLIIIKIIDLAGNIPQLVNSLTSRTLYTVSDGVNSIEVKSSIYYISGYIFIAITVIVLLLKLITLIRYFKLNVYIKYALGLTIGSIVLMVLRYTGLFGTGTLNSFMGLFLNIFEAISIMCITTMIRDFAVKANAPSIIKSANDYLRYFKILTIIGALLMSRLFLAIDILYLVLLIKARNYL